MAQGSSTVPPPPTGDPNVDVKGAGDGGKMDRFRQIISRMSGGGTPAIDAALEKHHQQKVAEATVNQQSAKRIAGILARVNASKSQEAPNGVDPTTGKPATPEQVQGWQQQFDAAWGAYSKIAGAAKEAKPIIQQMGGMLKHLTGHGGAGDKAGGAAPASPQGGGASAPPQQGGQTVPPPPQVAATPKPTVPPPPSAPGPQDAMAGSTVDEMVKEQSGRALKDEEYRDKLKADADPQYHVNALKHKRDDIKSAFPDMADADIEKAVLTKAGVIPKGAGKEMQPDFKDGMLVGVKSPGTNEYYTDPKTMPPEAKAIYDSAKNVEKEHTNAEEAKENRREAAQARLAELHEKIHDREQELAQSSKIPLTVAGRASQAEIIKEQTADLRAKLADPELQKLMGPIAGRTTGAAARLYNSKVQDFFASQESLDALLPLLHGYRGGAQTHETFKKSMGSLTISPEAYKGTLDALDKLSDNVVDEVESEYPNAPMFKNKRDAASAKSHPRGKTVSAPPDGKSSASPTKIKVTAEDMANAK